MFHDLAVVMSRCCEVLAFSCSNRQAHQNRWQAGGRKRRYTMSFIKQRETADPDKPEVEIEGNIRELVRQNSTKMREVGGHSEVTANNLSSLLGRVSENSTREIDTLIGKLQTLRDQLHGDCRRVEREIVEYAALSQWAAQLREIIANGITHLKKCQMRQASANSWNARKPAGGPCADPR